MFDLFGIKRRREERERKEKERLEKIKKDIERRIEIRRAVIDPYISKKNEENDKIGEDEYNQLKSECDAANSVCPKCGGKDIINRFVRVQGDLKGRSYSGPYTGSGSIEGSLDTLKVNECKACGNQWEIAEMELSKEDCTPADFRPYDYSSRIGFLYRRVLGVLEKDDDEKNELEPKEFLSCYKDTPREAIEYCLYIYGRQDIIYREDEMLGTKLVSDKKNPNYNANPYLFTLKDEIWKIAKIFIGREI